MSTQQIQEEKMRELARRMAAPEDILCLHALAQPLVSEMQGVIRFQRRQLDQCAKALSYVLERIRNEHEAAHRFGVCTEAYDRLTAALSEATDQDVDALRDSILPGSARLHRKTKMEEE